MKTFDEWWEWQEYVPKNNIACYNACRASRAAKLKWEASMSDYEDAVQLAHEWKTKCRDLEATLKICHQPAIDREVEIESLRAKVKELEAALEAEKQECTVDCTANMVKGIKREEKLRAKCAELEKEVSEIRNRTIMECAEFLEVGNYDVVTENYCWNVYDNANETISEIRTAILTLKGDKK